MVGTRGHPRFRIAKSAEIEHGGDKIPCSVRNISISGAALVLDDLAGRVPTHFKSADYGGSPDAAMQCGLASRVLDGRAV
jgi:hypothetical protein